ncbi:MAG TPA: ATP-dependent DNA helicase [Acidimicrobiales bacterium]|nr:ATP-dependent DNA helicase [Acidimicrobiales bacterium]
MSDRVIAALADVVAQLPGGATRSGQEAMARAVSDAVVGSRHLVVQAGTGTGKTLAYLVPAILSGRRTVVATATRALQDQLASKDLPLLTEHLDQPFTWAVLKGRSNYLCRQRLDEAMDGEVQLSLGSGAEPGDGPSPAELEEIADWVEVTLTGDRADLEREPRPSTWAAVSTGSDECPGATKCPRGEDCFAEDARQAAAAADVVVVNTHLYGTNLAAGGAVLPEHDLVVFDEAHQLEDTVSDTCGTELSGGRFTSLAHVVGGIIDDDELKESLLGVGDRIGLALAPDVGTRLRRGVSEDLRSVLEVARARLEEATAALRAITSDAADVKTRRERALKAVTGLVEDIDSVLDLTPEVVAWIEMPGREPRLCVAPLDVAPILDALVWEQRTAILTSATIPPGLADTVGLPAEDVDELDAGSPFDFGTQGLLYCAAHMPDPRKPGYEEALHEELHALITAAGGRTLALFTSHRAMQAAADALRDTLETPVLVQGDLPKPALTQAFADDEATSLFATLSFWQGVDVPGRSLSLVTIDKLPFPRPDEPLLQARREQARAGAFATVDLPRATTLLAQGVGRLIRTSTDRGVVAVLDSRLANASYRWTIVNALPPMKRTRHRAEAESLLKELTQA